MGLRATLNFRNRTAKGEITGKVAPPARPHGFSLPWKLIASLQVAKKNSMVSVLTGLKARLVAEIVYRTKNQCFFVI